MDDDSGAPKSKFQEEVAGRFGVLPNFFRSAQSAPGLIEELWGFAKSAYLDNPLPSLFKERLFVHLSRYCEVRYCIVRHVGFLVGYGRPAGDAAAPTETVDQVIDLLRHPLPDSAALMAILHRMSAHNAPSPMPASGSQAEADLFDALTFIFVEPAHSEKAREAVRAVVGDTAFELLAAYLAFIRTAHFWTETHPELPYEPDMLALMEERRDLAALMLDPSDAERVKTKRDLRIVLAELLQTEASLRESRSRLELVVAELQHRTQNLLAVVSALAHSTLRSSTDLANFGTNFQARLAALTRTQTLLTRVSGGEPVTFDELLQTELTALGALEDGSRVVLSGPNQVTLRTATVQVFALAIHELATNALKYGALSQPDATLQVAWRVEPSHEEVPWLHIDWRESGVAMPQMQDRPRGSGNGRTLIERALPRHLGARTSLVFHDDGIRCSISVPLSDLPSSATD